MNSDPVMMMVKSIAFILALSALLLTLSTMTGPAQANNLGISPADYANGTKRLAAVSQKVRPGLKKKIEAPGFQWGSPVFMRAFKEEKVLEVWLQKGPRFELLQTYPIAAASGRLGPKQAEGDRQVPEGFYFVKPSQLNPQSRFHLAFNIGYPNEFDRQKGHTGSFIMVHGSNKSIGCLAMTDPAIEEIYLLAQAALKNGQSFFRIHLLPFRMSEARMARSSASRWFPFWQNLQVGYRWFEEKELPPNVTVQNGRYHFD